MKGIFLFFFFIGVAHADWCADMKGEYSKKPYHWISCEKLRWGSSPSSNYLSDQYGELSKPLTTTNHKGEELPERSFLKATIEKNGYNGSPFERSLADKFADSMKEQYGEGSETYQWLSQEWKPYVQPKLGSSLWEGECDKLASLFAQPDFSSLVSFIPDAVDCGGTIYQRGELVALLGKLVGVINPAEMAEVAHVSKGSDVPMRNRALSALGVLGDLEKLKSAPLASEVDQSSKKVKPENFFAHLAGLSGQGLSPAFDIDPGVESWNHSIMAAWEARYYLLDGADGSDSDQLQAIKIMSKPQTSRSSDEQNIVVKQKTITEQYSMADFQSSPEQQELAILEKNLIVLAYYGQGQTEELSRSVCNWMSKIGYIKAAETRDYFVKDVPNACAQSSVRFPVDQLSMLFQSLKWSARVAGKLTVKVPNQRLELRQFKVEYAGGNDYLSNRTQIKERYYLGNILTDDAGRVSHSSWSTLSLTDDSYYVFDAFKAVPSNASGNFLKSYVRFGTIIGNDGSVRSKSDKNTFLALVNFIGACHAVGNPNVNVAEASSFYLTLTSFASDNELDPEEIASLKKLYDQYKPLISADAVKEHFYIVDGKGCSVDQARCWRVQGMEKLYTYF